MQATTSNGSASHQLARRTDLVVLPATESTPSDRSIEKRRLRKHYVLNVIRENPGLSRAEIAKTSGFNLPSVSSLVDELISDGLVAEEAARAVMRGRRPIPVYLCDNAASVLGIDIGKHSSMAILTNLAPKRIVTIERPTPRLPDAAAYGAWAVELARSVFTQVGENMPPLCGVGVALPGLVRSFEPGAQAASSEDTPAAAVRRELKENLGVEVLVDNDARIMVRGTQWFSPHYLDERNFAVLNVGIGLGLGVAVNGKPMEGASGFAGEIGHIPLGRAGVPCYCGRTGCLENVASGAALSQMAKDAGLETSDVEELAALARNGQQAARSIFGQFAESLGLGIATILSLFNPETLLLGGKVCRASDVFYEPLMASVERHALPASFAAARIVVENPDINLSSLGAVATVLHTIYNSSEVSFEQVI